MSEATGHALPEKLYRVVVWSEIANPSGPEILVYEVVSRTKRYVRFRDKSGNTFTVANLTVARFYRASLKEAVSEYREKEQKRLMKAEADANTARRNIRLIDEQEAVLE